MMRMRGMTAGVGGVVLAASLLLSGCSIFPTVPNGGGGTSGSGGSDSDGTSTDPGTDTSLDGYVGLPDTFPSDVPIVAGDVPVGIDLGTGWSVIVRVNDWKAGFTEAGDKLKAAGFTAQLEQSSDAGAFGDYITDAYEVQVTGQDAGEYGPTVSYIVVLK